MTKAEWHVWSRLRDKQLDGYKFRRQVPIGPYFVDFVCLSRRLVVEIDGAGHDSKEADVKDARKTAYLESQGFEVARFGVQELDETFEDVIQSIWWRLVRPRPDADIPSESGFADPTAPPVEPWRAPPTSPGK